MRFRLPAFAAAARQRRRWFGAWGVFGALLACPGCEGGADSEAEDGGTFDSVRAEVPVFTDAPLAVPEGEGCVAETHRAQSIPVDIALMLDASGSMLAPTFDGRSTRWDAIRAAFDGFLSDSRTQGVEVGLQFFPQKNEELPTACSTHAECGAAAPCSISFCADSYQPCVDDDGCVGGDKCVGIGTCAVSQAFCTVGGDVGCSEGEDCVQVTEGLCLNQQYCEAEPYSQPSVEIAPLETVRAELLASLNSYSPEGGTPTAPALGGLVAWARRNTLDNPHRTIAVMATDGLPTACEPTDIDEIAKLAEEGFNGTPSISTYVVGVVADGEQELGQNLHTLAQAGGTGSAILIGGSADLSAAFLEALYDIRQAALPCAFDIPEDVRRTLSYDKVNVEFLTPLSLPAVLYYVGNYDNCERDQGGWYFDVDPVDGDEPKRIFLCDAVCGRLRAANQARIELKAGCDRRELR